VAAQVRFLSVAHGFFSRKIFRALTVKITRSVGLDFAEQGIFAKQKFSAALLGIIISFH